MICSVCNKSILIAEVLRRTTPTGQAPNWMCEPCLEIEKPELFEKLQKDGGFEVVHDILEAVKC